MLLTGISYHHQDHVLVIALDTPGGLPEAVEHIPTHSASWSPAWMTGSTVIEVEDSQGHQTIVR